MLLNSYKITRVLPCLADPEKIRVIADISGEIHEVFPYLNATLKGCIYNHPALTLTIKKDGKLFTLHAHHITLAKIEDEKEAEEILGWLKNLINETYEKRDRIEPDFSKGADLKALDIFKLLPRHKLQKVRRTDLPCLRCQIGRPGDRDHKMHPSLLRRVSGEAKSAVRAASCRWIQNSSIKEDSEDG